MATRKTKSTPAKKTTSSPKSSPSKVTKKKTVTAKTTPVESTAYVQPRVEKSRRRLSLPALKVKRRTILFAVGVIVLIGLLVYYRSLFVVAVVNGQLVSRLEYIGEVESVYIQEARVTAGKQAMNQLITKTLINQEAKKKNITVSEKELDDQIASVRKNLDTSGQKLEDALALQGDTLEDYKERIRIQKKLEKLVGKIQVTDKEVTDYIATNKDSLPQELAEAELKQQVKTSLQQQKFNEKVQSLIQDLQKKAKVNYFVPQTQ